MLNRYRHNRRMVQLMRFQSDPAFCYRVSLAKALRDLRRHLNHLHHLED